jgi:ubiquinone/menaquinone biosynthesis C-methylase UbiE
MNNFENFTDQEWYEMLLKSVSEGSVGGIRFPKFPSAEIQSQFVGSSYEASLSEAYQFYSLLKKYIAIENVQINEHTKALDFGCGWGRFMRFFRKDIALNNLYGVDIDPSILDVCKSTGVDGVLSKITNFEKLSYPNNYFDITIAYSVFTHLPENVHLFLMRELARVLRSGSIFALTLEPLRFLEFIQSIDENNPASGWHAGLVKFKKEIPALIEEFKKGKFVYLPTGGGDFREADIYGDAVVSREYIEKNWSEYFEIVDYIDEPNKFWQAVLIVKRK